MVLKTMQTTKMEVAAVQRVFEQVVRELVLEREWDLAQGILREQAHVLS